MSTVVLHIEESDKTSACFYVEMNYVCGRNSSLQSNRNMFREGKGFFVYWQKELQHCIVTYF